MTIGKLNLDHIVPIVSDGAIGHPDIGDGRLIPVLVIDCSNHRALHDLILIHADTPPGDVIAKWGRRLLSQRYVYLTLEFKRPLETSATFSFDVSTQGGLVDWIINARAVYLQPSESGERVSEGLGHPKIVVEIPASANLPGWESLYRASLVKTYRHHGYSRKQAQEAASEHLARLRELWSKRIPRAKSEQADA